MPTAPSYQLDVFKSSTIESPGMYGEGFPVPVSERRRDSTKWQNMKDEGLINSLYVEFVILREEVSKLKEKSTRLTSLSTSINDLNSSKFILRAPINILINRENGLFYAEPVDFEIYGEGETEKDAIYNLKEVMVIYFENLKKSKKGLSKKLTAKLKLLEKTISCEN